MCLHGMEECWQACLRGHLRGWLQKREVADASTETPEHGAEILRPHSAFDPSHQHSVLVHSSPVGSAPVY